MGSRGDTTSSSQDCPGSTSCRRTALFDAFLPALENWTPAAPPPNDEDGDEWDEYDEYEEDEDEVDEYEE